MPKIIIAISSAGPRIGKSVTTGKTKEYLEKELSLTVTEHTIAKYIRELLNKLAVDLDKDTTRYFEDYSLKDVSRTFGKETVPFKTRDLLCDFSILLQKYYGITLWGDLAVKHIEEYSQDVVIIDDLRRYDEFMSLKNKYQDRLFTIYLDKEDHANDLSSLSQSAQAFETKLPKEEMDIVFTFNKDWSNLPELLEKIKDKVVTLS